MSYITKTYLETQFKNFAEKIKSLLNNKVDKVEGKGLSTNDLTSELKSNYDTAYDHSQSAHARTDATKVESSTTNGNIKINGTETTVYTHPSGTNPHGTTKSDVGLGNVPNVSTNDQTPSYTEATSLTKLTSGEKLSVAFGKISKAITDLISHIGDSVKHITSEERTNWNVAKKHADSVHAPSNAQANVIETVKVNGTTLTPSSKAVDITVPTNNNQLTNGAGYITSSGTAKTISDTLPISKGGTGKTTGVDAANVLINSLSTGDGNSTPTDNDYYISQLIGGGTTTATTYHRRPMSALWNYIKSKLATVATSGSYNDLTNKPTIPTVGNGTITITQNGTTKGTFTTNQSGNTTIKLTDNNTTYGVATSSALGLVKSGTDITVDSNGNVSVNDDSHDHVISNVDGLQSALNVRLQHLSVNSTVDFNDLTDTGVYHIRITNGTNQPTATNGTLFVDFEIGSPYQIWISDISTTLAYKRIYTNNKWTSWTQLKLTDTTYSAGTGISLSGTTFSNSGVRSISTGSTNGTISVNTNGTSAEVAVKGLGSAAYTGKTTAISRTHTDYGTNGEYVPSMNFLSYWNGAYNSSGSSNLTFCVQGNFGSIVTKSASDYATAKHTHDDRYYTETEIDNTLNSISSTIFNNNISKKNFTYVVYNPDTLRDWIENKSGNDYTSVLIRKGTYQYTVTNSNNFVSVNKQGTLYIEGEEGSKLFITYDAGVNKHYYLIRGVEKTNEDTSELELDMYPENPTNLRISSTTSSEEISRKRMSLNNVNIYLETYAHKNTSEYYIGILRFANGVNNCRFEIKLQCSCKQTTACCYYTCTNLNNCKGITTANYDSTLTPKTGYDRLRPYYNCKRVINCYAYGSSGYSGGAFYNGDHIINCNAKFEDMYYGETFYGINYVIGCRSYASVGTENGGSAKAYINCKCMLHNLALAGSYSNSYSDVSGNSTYLCANTLNGGWNSYK